MPGAATTPTRPLLFLDVDGPLLPFGIEPGVLPPGYLAHEIRPEPWWLAEGPMVARLNPAHGPRLLALPCDLVWATAWMQDANEWIGPRIGLPRLPVLLEPDAPGTPDDPNPSDTLSSETTDAAELDEAAERMGLHWKTRALVDWADGRPFAWVDDEISDVDRLWVEHSHAGPALLHRVDPRSGLTDDDFAALEDWFHGLTA